MVAMVRNSLPACVFHRHGIRLVKHKWEGFQGRSDRDDVSGDREVAKWEAHMFSDLEAALSSDLCTSVSLRVRESLL